MTNNDIFGAIAKNYGNYENYDLWQHCYNHPPWLGENFAIFPSKMTKKATIIIHHGGRKFEIYPSEMTEKNPYNHPQWSEKILRFTLMK